MAKIDFTKMNTKPKNLISGGKGKKITTAKKKSKGAGRKPMKKEVKKDCKITFYLNKTEYEMIESHAQKEHLPISTFVLFRIIESIEHD